jgi:N4-gp56 family major capsid protein
MITTTTTLPAQVQQSFDDKLLSIRTPSLIHTLAATPKKLPNKGGRTLRMSRYQRLPTFPVPLGPSGATPPATSVSRVDIDATMSFFGQFIAVNQQVTLQNQDPVLNAFAELLGLSLRMTEDQLTRDMMAATASAYNCTGGNNGDLPTNMALSDFDEVTSALLSNDAWMIFDQQEGEDKFGTGPVRNAFLGLGHTDLSKDFNNLPGFLPKWNYPDSRSKTVSSEWGAVNNIRFLLSSVGSVEPLASGLGASVYNIFVQGLESLGIVEQDNYTSRFLFRPAVYSDPLFQNVTLGTVFAQVPRILNDLWLTKVRCTLNT